MLQKNQAIVEKRAVVAGLSKEISLLEQERPDLEAVVGGTKSREGSKTSEDVIRPQILAKAREELANKISELSEQQVLSANFVRVIPELLTVVEELSSAEFVTLVQEMSAEKSNDSEKILIMILASVAAESDPETILSSDFSSLGTEESQVRITAFASLLREDPQRALRWLEEEENLSEDERGNLSRLVAMDLFGSEPKAALDYLRKSNLTRVEFNRTSSVLPPDLTSTQTAHIAMALSEESDSDLRKSLSLSLVTQTVAKEGPGSLKTIVDQLYNEDEIQLKAQVLLGNEIYKDVQSAEEATAFLDYASTYSDDFAETVLRNIISDWAHRDYTAAGEYLGALPESSQRDAGIVAFATQVSHVDPVAALNWAASMQNPKKAGETQKKIFDQWLRRARPEAEEWARENGTPGE